MAIISRDREFLELTRPILEAGDLDLLVRQVERRWPRAALRELLFSDCRDVAKVALFSLSLVGTMDDCPTISCLLRHEDAYVSRLAEHALWSIWLRGDGPRTDLRMQQAVHLIAEDRLDEALRILDALIRDCPGFAEAYNQRAIIHFLRADYDSARRDLNVVLRNNPVHFAALAGLGHCCAAEGRCEGALAYYREALRIHPRAEGLSQAVAELSRWRRDAVGTPAKELSPLRADRCHLPRRRETPADP